MSYDQDQGMLERINQFVRAKRYEEALIACKDELTSRPDDPLLLNLLAVAHYFNEDYAEAVMALEQIIETHDGNIDALLLLALLCSWGYGGGYSKAPDLYQKVLALNDKEVDAYIGLALSRDSPGVQMTIQQSIELLQRALEIDPARPEIHNNLAYAYWEAGQYDEATRHFKKLLETSDTATRPVIRSKLRALKAHRKPRNIAYLGPALPRLP